MKLEVDHRRRAEVENAIRDLEYGVGLNHLPSGRFPAETSSFCNPIHYSFQGTHCGKATKRIAV